MPLESGFMATFSTEIAMQSQDAIANWGNMLARAGVSTGFKMAPPPDYRAQLAVRGYDQLGVLSATTSSAVFGGDPSETDPGAFTLSFSRGPVMGVTHAGRHSQVEPGQAVLLGLDDESTIDLRAEGTGGLTVLRLPNHAVEPALIQSGMGRNCVLHSHSTPYAILWMYLSVLQREGGIGSVRHQKMVVTHIHDLVALALGATGDLRRAAVERSAAGARLYLLKGDIETHLFNPALGAAFLARRQGITPRHVHRLFETEGRSLSAYLIERRLIEAYRLLGDPGNNGSTIADLAFGLGFNDLSYFNRLFNRRFAARPGDVRAIFGTSRGRHGDNSASMSP